MRYPARITVTFAVCVIFALLIAVAGVSVASANTDLLVPFRAGEVWTVTTGYNSSPCHLRPSPCGGDEYFAFDLVPESGDAGGRYVLAPAAGRVIEVFQLSQGCSWGWFVKLQLDDGNVLHLYHLMNVTKTANERYSPGETVGQVYDRHPCGNHLHIQLTTSSGLSIPLSFEGRAYGDTGGADQWRGERLARGGASVTPPNSARRDTIASYYRELLGREPDAAGLDGWDRSGLSLEQVRAGIIGSDEYRQKHAAPPPSSSRRDTIASYYRELLGREPDAAGLDGWDRSGLSLEQVRAGIIGSDEYRQKHAAPPPATVYPIPGLAGPDDGASVALNSSVTFSWTNTGAAQYKIEIWNDTGPGSISTIVSGTSAQFSLSSEGSWRWQVRSISSTGQVGDAPFTRTLYVYSGPQQPNYRPTFAGQTVSFGGNNFRSLDGRTWTFQGADRDTSCATGTDGIILFRDRDFSSSGGCLFRTGDDPDFTSWGSPWSLRLVGGYVNRFQVLLYRQPNYQDLCGTYVQDQSDLRNCPQQARSIQIIPYAAPTPIPAPPGVTLTGNIAGRAALSPTSASPAVDGNLSSEWLGGHKFTLTLTWAQPAMIHRIVVWDRTQNSPDNNQINLLDITFGDGSSIRNLDMSSGGPRCVDVEFSPRSVTSITVQPVDASGTNGLREIEVWATTGAQSSSNSCVMQVSR